MSHLENKPLTGLNLLAVGKLAKNKDELKAAVEDLGGKITGSANKAALCLSTKKEVEKMSKKMEAVMEAGVRVVSETFLTDIKSSGKALQELVSLHAISPWGSEVKLEAQAPAAASKSGAVAVKRAGRVKEGEVGSKATKMKLRARGGGAVDPDSDCSDARMEADCVYDQNEEAVKLLTASAGTKSLLAKPIQELIRMIFDVERMKKAMVEFEIDLQKMPLGKLGKSQIQSAYALLSEVQQAVSESASESHILDLSNRFYTLIPHDFGMKKPPLLSNPDYFQAKVQMLDNLREIEVAYSLLRGGTEDNKKDPIDLIYEKLKTTIEVVDKSTKEAEIILQYVKNTHDATNTYTLEVEEIFEIDREGEYERYLKALPNRRLLWHGSRTTNYAGILSQGLRMAPPEAPVTGYMFGKGVYFTDMVSKSATSCHTSQSDPTGLLLLGDVALGNMYELKESKHITQLPKGRHSVQGVGRTAPDPSAKVTFDGLQVPLGKGTNTNIDDTSLLYNEYVVYFVSQVNLRYLIKTKFNYQAPL